MTLTIAARPLRHRTTREGYGARFSFPLLYSRRAHVGSKRLDGRLGLGPLQSVPQVSLEHISCPSVSLKISKCPSVSLNNLKCPSPRGTHWTSRCPSRVLWCPSKCLGVPQYSSKVQIVPHHEGHIGWPGVPYVSLGHPQKFQVSSRGTPWMDRCP